MLTKIIDIATKAGNILMKYYDQNLEIQTKSDSFDYLTKADLESDEYIRKRLKEEFPKDKILSEENENIPINYEGRVWMVDPLDGTKDYVNKGTGFSVLIGLCENGVPILGVVYAPAKKHYYTQKKGKKHFQKKKERKQN